VEFYSDAKLIHEDVEGLVWVESNNATEGGALRVPRAGCSRCCVLTVRASPAAGVSVDTGGGNAFGGAEEDEGAEDHEETKLDQFWQFGEIEVCWCTRPDERPDCCCCGWLPLCA
jgi:hypothetical protein